jgi:hypothetical protein
MIELRAMLTIAFSRPAPRSFIDDVLRRRAAGQATTRSPIPPRLLQIRDEAIGDVLRLAAGVRNLHPHRQNTFRDGRRCVPIQDADRPAAELRRDRPALRPFARHREAIETHKPRPVIMMSATATSATSSVSTSACSYLEPALLQ